MKSLLPRRSWLPTPPHAPWGVALMVGAAAVGLVAAGRGLAFVAETPIQGPLTLANFVKGTTDCYDRRQRQPLAVVDAHLHGRPFGGPPMAWIDLLAELRRSGVLFANLYGIGQRLPEGSSCVDPDDCPGVMVRSSLKSDFSNAQNSLDLETGDLKLVLSMSFPDLSRPAEVLPQMAILDREYPGLFRWMGEVNLVKQALYSHGHQAVPIDRIAAWKPFMAELRRRHMPIAIHSDLGHDQQPLRYLPLMQRVLSLYPDNRIVWMHLGLSRELKRIDARQHRALLESLLRRYPNLSFDISWRVLDDQVFSDPARRQFYVDLFNRWPRRFIPGTDFVAAAGKSEVAYREELAVTSAVLGKVNDEAFRRIALGQNFFELAGLEAVAPPICRAAH
ncbi:MAG: amidohydrolase family protein [Cyanobium sp.]